MRVYKRVGNVGVSLGLWYFILIYPFVFLFQAMWYMTKTALLFTVEVYKWVWRGCAWCVRRAYNLIVRK